MDTRFDALVDLLLTVGYVDGVFDQHEKDFVHRYVDQLVQQVAIEPGATETSRAHFDAVYARLETEIAGLAAEVVAAGDEGFVRSRLKVRAVTLFRAFPPGDQAVALQLVEGLVSADGTVTPIERSLYDELRGYFQAAPPPARSTPELTGELLRIEAPRPNELAAFTHPLLDPLEQPYAAESNARQTQVGRDYELIFQAITAWERQRARGNGRLAGISDLAQLPIGTHEQVDAGFRAGFDVGGRRLYTLFSAGGHDNPDLPADSRYRNVTPMALSIRREAASLQGIPWPILYQPFGSAEHNGLYRP